MIQLSDVANAKRPCVHAGLCTSRKLTSLSFAALQSIRIFRVNFWVVSAGASSSLARESTKSVQTPLARLRSSS